MTNIVIVKTTQTIAPEPATLQSSGALVSVGGTTQTAGNFTFLTQLSDLTSLLTPAAAITSLTWASEVVTVTTSAPHGLTDADIYSLTITGAVPVGYNGTFACTVTGASTFTYALTDDPGAETTPGTWAPASTAELLSMATTFFAQGASQGVFVLELGIAPVATAIAALSAYIVANPNSDYVAGATGYFYSYLLPREWDANSALLAMLAEYENPDSSTYFYITSTTDTYTSYTNLMKCAKVMIEAPSIPALEFSHAADFQHDLAYAPSSINLVTPNAFAYLFGVTPYPTKGNSALLATLKATYINIVGTGAEGGISDTILLYGTTMDGRDFSYWYSVDWVALNLNLDISNAIINGSNNPQNPLYYDQAGINTLQAVAQDTMGRAVSFGLALGPITVTAVPFATYVKANPSDFPEGVYNGLGVTYTPNRGFTSITFNVNVTDFPAGG